MKTVRNLELGERYISFTKNVHELGNSHILAEKRLRGLERKLANSSELHTQYVQFMREHMALGHMIKVSADNQL